MTSASTPARPRPLIGWRLLALFYDMWPAVAMWFAVSFTFNLGYLLAGHGEREFVAPFTALGWLLWVCCWAVTGLYATISWRRGGQTLGMRPWRIRVCGTDGAAASWRALWLRYLVGTVSLLAAGLGFWWAWIDRDRLTWHDRASGTRLIRDPKPG